ncbi:MAG TPA: KH domain-containing protein [Candidatus Saccharimonadales bacterium]|nr:KH domain-containing protein [Candidatus Saccharimonadales bacterium]
MKDALYYIVSAIVDNKEALRVEEEDVEGVVTFTIFAAKEDMGRLIGKEGKVIRAVRNVMKIPAMKEHKKVQIQLGE